MNDSKTMGDVSTRLLAFISTTSELDTNFEIAMTMLKHYNKLNNLTLAEIADLCFVSNASISRFCRLIGFDSFKEFHDYLSDDHAMDTSYSRSFLNLVRSDYSAAVLKFSTAIMTNVKAVMENQDAVKMNEMVDAIAQANHIAYFSHHFLWDVGRQMQSKLIHMNRVLELHLDFQTQLDCARSLKKGDLAILCSIGGSYPFRYPTIWNAIVSSGCDILVITQSESVPYWNQVKYLLNCGVDNLNDVGKYGALAAADLLILRYIHKYRNKY